MAELILRNGTWVRCSSELPDKSVLEIPGVQAPTVTWARNHGIVCVKLQGPGNKSRPDFMFLVPGGKVTFIEFKRPGEAPNALQTHTYKKFQGMGFDIRVHDSKESAIAYLRELLEAK